MKGGVGMSNGKIKSRFLTNPYLFSVSYTHLTLPKSSFL